MLCFENFQYNENVGLSNKFKKIINTTATTTVGWDSVINIVTCYGLDCLGIESKWGQDFLHLSRLALGPTQAPSKWVRDLFPECKTTGVWC